MHRKAIVAVLISAAAALSVSLSACSSDEQAAPDSPSSSATLTTQSAFGTDATDVVSKLHRDNATAIIETVEQRGGSSDQAVAALLSAEAETGWRSGLSMAPPSTDIRDIFGWRYSYSAAADSTEAVVDATNTFMDNTIRVTSNATADSPAYALAVQRADPRGYNDAEHFYKSGETPESEYTAALPRAQAAFSQLRP